MQTIDKRLQIVAVQPLDETSPHQFAKILAGLAKDRAEKGQRVMLHAPNVPMRILLTAIMVVGVGVDLVERLSKEAPEGEFGTGLKIMFMEYYSRVIEPAGGRILVSDKEDYEETLRLALNQGATCVVSTAVGTAESDPRAIYERGEIITFQDLENKNSQKVAPDAIVVPGSSTVH